MITPPPRGRRPQELAADEPQVLILDDVLVNTDPVRQERILDVLGTQAARLQILIRTCHPDRYRGTGKPLSLQSIDFSSRTDPCFTKKPI